MLLARLSGARTGVDRELLVLGPKLRANAERDTVNTRSLESSGWTVVRVWEHKHTEDVVAAIEAALAPRLKLLSLRAKQAASRWR